MARYDVFQTGGEGAPKRLGQAEIDATGHLSLIEAEPGAKTALEQAFADLNERDGLIVKLPPGEGQGKFAIRKDKIMRDDPRFLSAIEDNLARWHEMAIKPAG